LYLMFMRPYNESGDWNDDGIQGTWRFVNRIYQLVFDNQEMLRATIPNILPQYEIQKLNSLDKILYRKTNQTLKKVEENIHEFHFNTAISSLMELLNEFTNQQTNQRTNEITTWCIHKLVLMLAPLAPHFAEELNEMLGNKESLFKGSKWIRYDETAITEDEVTIAVQINGKLRDTMKLPIDTEDEVVKSNVLASDAVKKYVDGKTIAKVVVVKNKLVSIVVK